MSGRGRGRGTGSPSSFFCAKCRVGRRVGDNTGAADRCSLTGRTKPTRAKRKTYGRQTDTRREYVCGDCGHVGWSTHEDIRDYASKPVPDPTSSVRNLRYAGPAVSYSGAQYPGDKYVHHESPPLSDYITLCGETWPDGIVETSRKVNCPACLDTVKHCIRLSATSLKGGETP